MAGHRAAQQPIIVDTDGIEHDWRAELADAIMKRQRKDGSWINPEDRWMEGNDGVDTVYAVLAAEEILKPAPWPHNVEVNEQRHDHRSTRSCCRPPPAAWPPKRQLGFLSAPPRH